MIGYKKVEYYWHDKDGRACIRTFIAKLSIPKDAQVVGPFRFRYKRKPHPMQKYRASEAKVLGLYTMKGKKADRATARSQYDPAFPYRVGDTVQPRFVFDPDKTVDCGSGIHFFKTVQEAREW